MIHHRSPLRRPVSLGLALAGLFVTPVWAQDFERIAPHQPPAAKPAPALPAPEVTPPLPEGRKVLVPALQGLVFLNRGADVERQGVSRPGIAVAPGSLLDDPAFQALMAPFLDRPVTLDHLNEIARLTVLFFREHDRPLVDVVVPEQNITTGTIQLVTVEFVAGTITTEGNEWFDSSLLLAGIRTARGEPISGQALLDDINRLNENPFRHSDLVYQRGKNPGESDIVLRTQDRFPLRVFAGTDNTGSATTSRNRVFAGFNWGNAWQAGHILSYQYTASPDAAFDPRGGRYSAHALTYQIPLSWRDTLTMFGSYSRSRPDLPEEFRQTGISGQASVRYTMRLPRWQGITHSLDLGADFKRSNNDLEFGGTTVSRGFTDIFQGVAGYAAARPDAWGSSGAALTLFLSPGGLDAHNNTAAFRPAADRSGRPFAEARYAYLRMSLERRFDLPEDFSWYTKVQGQWSSTNLLASEQLGAGGADNIRGYEEREANGDQGVIVSNELRTPEIKPGRVLGIQGLDDSLQLLGFWDYGRVSEKRAPAGQKSAWTLSSVGVGARYSLSSYLSAKLDWGHALPGTGNSNGFPNSNHVHFGLTLAY